VVEVNIVERTVVTQWPRGGAYTLEGPHGVAATDTLLAVSELPARRVTVIEAATNIVMWRVRADLTRPTGLRFSRSRDSLYVADGNHVTVLAATDGGAQGRSRASVFASHSLCDAEVTGSGLLVADPENGCVVKVDLDPSGLAPMVLEARGRGGGGEAAVAGAGAGAGVGAGARAGARAGPTAFATVTGHVILVRDMDGFHIMNARDAENSAYRRMALAQKVRSSSKGTNPSVCTECTY
jgi:hypothetical protein